MIADKGIMFLGKFNKPLLLLIITFQEQSIFS